MGKDVVGGETKEMGEGENVPEDFKNSKRNKMFRSFRSGLD